MKICICDDEDFAREQIKKQIDSYKQLNKKHINITCLASGEELLHRIKLGESFDIVFLDIEMKEISGIATAETLRQVIPSIIIIFVSNYPNYVFDAFKVEALHFLVKPFSEVEFQNVFQRALNKCKNQHSTITLRWQSERYVLKIEDIRYVEGYKRHITVYTTEGNYEALGKIPEIFEILEPHDFIQTHQGFIVNMDYIKRFDRSDVVLLDNSKVMISVRRRTEALRAFDNYLKRRKW